MLKFLKMEGIGNDYVYFDGINQNVPTDETFIKKVSNRHIGIGSDGAVMEVYKGETVGDLTKWRIRIYNFVDIPLKIGRIPRNGSTDDSYYIQS